MSRFFCVEIVINVEGRHNMRTVLIVINIFIIILLAGCTNNVYDETYKIGKYEITKDMANSGKQTGIELTDELSIQLKEKYDKQFTVYIEAYYRGYSMEVDYYASPIDEPDVYFHFDVEDDKNGNIKIINSDYEDVIAKVNYAHSIGQKVIFIYQYTNYADEEINKGYYIDNNGYKVDFDFSNTIQARECETIEELYSLLVKDGLPQGNKIMAIDKLADCYKALQNINENAELEDTGNFANDAGSKCWYGVIDNNTDSPQIILLQETGNIERYNTDSNAKFIMETIQNGF